MSDTDRERTLRNVRNMIAAQGQAGKGVKLRIFPAQYELLEAWATSNDRPLGLTITGRQVFVDGHKVLT